MTAFSLLMLLAPVKRFTGTVRVNSFEEHTHKRFTIKIGLDSLVNYGSVHFAMHSTVKHGQMEYTISHPYDSTVCASTQHFCESILLPRQNVSPFACCKKKKHLVKQCFVVCSTFEVRSHLK